MEQTKKEWSESFKVFKAFKDAVHSAPENQAGGTHSYTTKDGETKELPNLKYTVDNFQTYDTKDGKKNSSFTLGKYGAESVKFVLTESGSLRGAEYVNWEGVEKGKAPTEKVWCKDFEKLSATAKDSLLTDLSGKMDWSKTAEKEEEAEDDKER